MYAVDGLEGRKFSGTGIGLAVEWSTSVEPMLGRARG